jgi:outer membrane protein assembly factor BamC
VISLIRVFALLTVVLLTGCSYIPGMERYVTGETGVFRDRQTDYLKAESIPRTRVPDYLDSFMIDDLLVVPDLGGEEVVAFLDAPRPRPVHGRSDRGVVIQRINERSWVVVDTTPGQLWPRIRDFWAAKGVDIAQENPTSGVMETGWFNSETSLLNRDKYRVIVDSGFQPDSAEIRLLHITMPQAAPLIGMVNWPTQSADLDAEFNMLTQLSNYLADVSGLYTASSVSFLAARIPSQGKAFMEPGRNGRNALKLRADFERSYAAVGRALQRAGANVISQDAANGIYQVTFDPDREPEEEKGFWGNLFTFGGKKASDDHLLKVEILDTGELMEVQVESMLEGPSSGTPQAIEQSLLQAIRDLIA